MAYRRAVLIFLLLCAAQCTSAQTVFSPLVRVHLARFFDGSGALTVTPSEDFHADLIDSNGATIPLGIFTAGRAITIEAQGKASTEPRPADIEQSGLCSLATGQSIRLQSSAADPDALLSVQRDPASKAHRYRGSFIVTTEPNVTLRIFDSLPLEDYLKGVVGPEMGSTAPLEALKAQAITARTYTVKNFCKCWADGGEADLDDTTRCQNYLGYDAENWRCRTAVSQTAGKILTYNGMPIDAVYATDCGGESGIGTEPYLMPVHDADCASEQPWTVSVTLAQLGDAVGAVVPGASSSAPSDVRVDSVDKSGRVVSVTVTEKYGSVKVTGAQLRKAVGYDRLRSTLFAVKLDSLGNCIFTGRGWGHGMGMCQNGAMDMARTQAATCSQILNHYYTGVELTDLTSDFLQNDDDVTRDAYSSTIIPDLSQASSGDTHSSNIRSSRIALRRAL